MSEPGARLRTIRTALWHFRKGGLNQLRTWQRRRALSAAHGDSRPALAEQALTFVPVAIPERPPQFTHVRAAVILDEFSLLSWQYEFEVVPVTPQQWQSQIEAAPVDILLVESAWHGNADAWQYQLTGSKAPSAALRELVEHCQETGVPTVFWNKEDPPHYEDFLATARLFDHVFTTDITLIPQYQRELGHRNVHVLPFAAQTAVHNPVRPQHGYQERDIAFAGMYFAHKFPERREQMDLLLHGALDVSPRMTYGLEIFSRFLGEDARYQFPGELGGRVVGSLEYSRMLTAYKAYKTFLNVNSVVESPSMCARRIFEISASGTPVVSTPSAAISRFFPENEVPTVETRQQAADTVRALVRSRELRDRTVHRAQRRIWSEHTYTHRAESVLRAAGVGTQGPGVFDDSGGGELGHLRLPTVSALAVTNRPGQLEHVISQVSRQEAVQRQMVLVTHGFDVTEEARRLAKEYGVEDLVVAVAPAEWSLGRCLNRGVEKADGEVLSKMDDDDLYGPHYLQDLLHARAFSGADVVGKHAHYMYLRGTDATLLRFPWMEHRYTDRVMGPTITAGRDVFRQHTFDDISRGEDSGFLQSVVDAGGRIYSADRFQFTQWRGSATHAWVMDDRQILATADVAYYGRNDAHVNA